jgi:hypothetical protein
MPVTRQRGATQPRKTGAHQNRSASAPGAPKEVTRNIAVSVQCLLWGRAAGRCEFRGCNTPLWKSCVTQEQINIAEKAHIYSFSSRGPRGNAGIATEKIHVLTNLMLVCHACHRKIDGKRNLGRYSVFRVQAMKAAHERRIEIVSGIAAEKNSDILLYGANIGKHSSPLNYAEVALALFPDRYPAADRAIELSLRNSSSCERDDGFWRNESFELRRKFDRLVRAPMAEGAIRHLSVFALAPQPLLVLLGTMLGDIFPCDVYQRHREPVTTWEWPEVSETPPFRLRRPECTDGPAALLFDVSATVDQGRIRRVLGEQVSIWSIGVSPAHSDVVKSRGQTARFRALVRAALNQIKAAHGHGTTLHVFPVMPVSLAVEAGRVRMGKSDMPWVLYDQVDPRSGFVPALSLPEGENE